MSVDELKSALIGYSGFVGSILGRQQRFDEFYRSSNISEIDGSCFDLVVCSAAPAQKWIANRDPSTDFQNIKALIEHLKRMRARTFVLISTVDVFMDPVGVDELTKVNEDGLHSYGLHRRVLEKFIEEYFDHYLIVRLPGLVGPGLRKNLIFDFLNDNNLHAIDSRGIFQFYPMVNLWYDIQIALKARLKLIHLTSEPINVYDVATQGFNRTFNNVLSRPPMVYDMRTRYAELFGSSGFYQYSLCESIQAIRAYAQSEPHVLKTMEDRSK